MPINKDDPRFPEYVAKCEELFNEYDKVIEEIYDSYPPYKGQDHPSSVEIAPLERERNQKLRGLQREYAFLFRS